MTLDDVWTEGKVIAALFREPAIVADLGKVDLECFTDPRCQSAFAAFRNLQARGCVLEANEVDAEIRRQDAVRGTCVAEMAGLAFIAILLLTTEPYSARLLWLDEIEWLRILAGRRQQIRNAS